MSTPEAPNVSLKLVEIIAHLRAGNVQAADDLAAETLAAQVAAAAAAAGKIPPVAPPRAAPLIWLDLAHRVSALLGHPPAIEELLAEMAASREADKG